VAAKRRRWHNRQTWLNPERSVFIDETGAKTTMARLRGRALSGQRLHATVPWGHWKTTTFVASLRVDGVTAPMVLDGAMTGAAFKAHVEPVLVPSLRPGDIVIMDNLPSHEVEGVRKAIKRAGACRPTPPTSIPSNRPSPSSKPSCAKPLPEPPDDLWQTIADGLEQLDTEECANFFRNSDYAPYLCSLSILKRSRYLPTA